MFFNVVKDGWWTAQHPLSAIPVGKPLEQNRTPTMKVVAFDGTHRCHLWALAREGDDAVRRFWNTLSEDEQRGDPLAASKFLVYASCSLSSLFTLLQLTGP